MNSRSGCPDGGFRNRCTRPLCDSSRPREYTIIENSGEFCWYFTDRCLALTHSFMYVVLPLVTHGLIHSLYTVGLKNKVILVTLLEFIYMRSLYQVCVVVNFSILKTFQGFGARRPNLYVVQKQKASARMLFAFVIVFTTYACTLYPKHSKEG